MRFVTQEIAGHEGLVRNLFAARDLGTPSARGLFPGVRGVAIMPKGFDDSGAAAAWLEETAERGGVALAVSIGVQRWLIGAWVST
jgi:hypothetical protein